MITRSGSAHGCDAAQRPVVSMSLNASSRPRPLSASSNARPNPPDPRTFGSTQAYPCETKNAVYGDQRTFELLEGPPWYQTITGNFAARFLGSWTITGNSSPSCALTLVRLASISGGAASDGRGSSRNRATLPRAASTTHASV